MKSATVMNKELPCYSYIDENIYNCPVKTIMLKKASNPDLFYNALLCSQIDSVKHISIYLHVSVSTFSVYGSHNLFISMSLVKRNRKDPLP